MFDPRFAAIFFLLCVIYTIMRKGLIIGILALVIVIVISIIIIIIFATKKKSSTAAAAVDTDTPAPASTTSTPTIAPYDPSLTLGALGDTGATSALDDTYGFYEGGNCTNGECLYGNVFNMKKSSCATIGGAWNGNPADDEIIPCHMRIGKLGKYAFGMSSKCPHQASLGMTGSACKALGGTSTAPSDAEMGSCSLGICARNAAIGGLVPSAGAMGQMQFAAANSAQCTGLGGISSGGDWSTCKLGVKY